jgi:hypothetical protein
MPILPHFHNPHNEGGHKVLSTSGPPQSFSATQDHTELRPTLLLGIQQASPLHLCPDNTSDERNSTMSSLMFILLFSLLPSLILAMVLATERPANPTHPLAR